MKNLHAFFDHKWVRLGQLFIPVSILLYYVSQQQGSIPLMAIGFSDAAPSFFLLSVLSVFQILLEAYKLKLTIPELDKVSSMQSVSYGHTCSALGPAWLMDLVGKGLILKQIPFGKLFYSSIYLKWTQWISTMIIGLLGLGLFWDQAGIEIYKQWILFGIPILIMAACLIWLFRKIWMPFFLKWFSVSLVFHTASWKTFPTLTSIGIAKTFLILLQYIIVANVVCMAPPDALSIMASMALVFFLRSFLPSLGWMFDYFSRYAIANAILATIGLTYHESLLLTSMVLIINQVVPISITCLFELFSFFDRR